MASGKEELVDVDLNLSLKMRGLKVCRSNHDSSVKEEHPDDHDKSVTEEPPAGAGDQGFSTPLLQSPATQTPGESPTNKMRCFLKERVGEKGVEKLPGLGLRVTHNLEKNGITKAYMVIGKYLVLGQNREEFQKWLRKESQCGAGMANTCCDAVKKYCEEYVL